MIRLTLECKTSTEEDLIKYEKMVNSDVSDLSDGFVRLQSP